LTKAQMLKIGGEIAFLLFLCFVQNYCYAQGNMDPDLYRITLGPFLEEAFKGMGVVFLLSVVSLNPQWAEKLSNKKWWVITGVVVGLSFGLYEMFVDYTPGLHRVLPTLGHVFETTIVAVGIWWFNNVKKNGLLCLGFSYIGASILHALWNYHAYVERTAGPEFVLGTVVIILAAIWFVRVLISGDRGEHRPFLFHQVPPACTPKQQIKKIK